MRRALFGFLLLTLLLGACGGSDVVDPSEDPKQAVIDAFERLGEADGTTMTISLDSNEASLSALIAPDAANPPAPQVLAAVLGSSLTISGNNATEPEDAEGEMIFAIDGEPMVESVFRGYDLYAHADVPAVMEAFGEDPDQLEKDLDEIPPQMSFMRDLVEGDWLKLTGSEQFLSAMGGDPSQVMAQQERLARAMSQTFEENAEFDEGDDEGPGTNIDVRVQARPLLERFLNLAFDGAQVPPGARAGREIFETALADMPEGDFIIDTWIEGGRVTQLRLDVIANLEEFDAADDLPDGMNTFAVIVEFTPYEPQLEVPADPVEVSLQEIMSTFIAVPAYGSSSVEATPEVTHGDACKEVAELPKKQQEPFKDICPDL